MEEMTSIFAQIADICGKCESIEKVLLFGSRARRTNSPKSDIDLAVYSHRQLVDFVYDLESKVDTLLEFDVTLMSDEIDERFKKQIEKEGIVVYEKS